MSTNRNLEEQGTSNDDSDGEEISLTKLRRVDDSKIYNRTIRDNEIPIIYSNDYNIAFFGVEKLHVFDSKKWGNVYKYLIESGNLRAASVIKPTEATREDLLVVHSKSYLRSLNCPCQIAKIVEIPFVAFIPSCLIERRGTILAARLALETGWAINIGGGFHHASAKHGGGFCIYADITLALKFLFLDNRIKTAMIGNGHENDFLDDDRVYIFDMFNTLIYPHDTNAKAAIRRPVQLKSGIGDESYLHKLRSQLNLALNEFKADIVIYNAGTDILINDPLGDECVFELVSGMHKIPIVMVTSGGYLRESARVIADSILNLDAKNLIQLN